MPPRRDRSAASGLPDLRRAGAITELLFLYEIVTRETTQLQPIAVRLGLTVQAVSHVFRQLERDGFVTHREGRYRGTVEGVAWLHAALGGLRQDVEERWSRLDVVRTGRAIARTSLAAGDRVALELRDGELTARKGSGASTGRALRPARAGELVEIGELSGIVPVERGRIAVWTFRDNEVAEPWLVRDLARALRSRAPALLAAFGLEAGVLARAASERPAVRFGIAAAVHEASQLGVGVVVLVRDAELPRLLRQLDRSPPLPIDTGPIPRARVR